MKDPQPAPIYRRDYATPSHFVDSIELHFELGEEITTVRSRMQVRSNPDARASSITLDGEHLSLVEVRVDGEVVEAGRLSVTDTQLVIAEVPADFVLETTVETKPQENTALTGLYKSSGNYCTQCEAQGFRRITYSLDRPDVMARYRTTIVADKTKYPVLLSNGNKVDSGEKEGGRHYVVWEDPHPKPSYLFALVAGDLRAHTGSFTTVSGREVRLEIWVEPQNIESCEHALKSLQKSMTWDEETFGLEYDLDIYMIVAVNDFNMGAMENKGLNVFNSKYVLAQPESATDDDYEAIEAVIAHEYFHNWTGNRVTCRDWFQLTLKEGLTVFRDQQFTADQTSAAVKRIDDVKGLRVAQYSEDAGPMSHPIRPESYIEMNNFYTATVYEKGAEVIRMIHTLAGKDGFRRGMDLYFERHDGQAVTCDDFRAAMADANGLDLAQFEHWYSQRGTPRLHAKGEWDAGASTYRLTLRQEGAAVLGDEAYRPRHMPVRVGLLDPQGKDCALQLEGEDAPAETSRLLELRELETTYAFVGLDACPVPSVLRGFTSPVELRMERSQADLAFLMAHDSDSFNRWDAGQTFARSILLDAAKARGRGEEPPTDPEFIRAWGTVLADPGLDGSLKALALQLPRERVLGQAMEVVAVDEIHAAREAAMQALGAAHRDALLGVHESNRGHAYDASATSIQRRRLCNVALRYLAAGDPVEGAARALDQFHNANNMTDQQAALACLVDLPGAAREEALSSFYETWKTDPLVLNKWFAVQAQSAAVDTMDRVLELAKHADFTRSNPNRLRSLVGVFGVGNQVHFHAADGRGYAFVAEEVLAVDAMNPQTAARLVSSFNPWRRFDERRRDLQREQLERIVAHPGLSRDVYEIVHRALAEA